MISGRSNKDQRKKDRERFLLDRFLEDQNISPTSITPSEDPDFLVELDGRLVGIELTEVYIRSAAPNAPSQFPTELLLQTFERVTDQIVIKARTIYLNGDNPLVLAHIVFSNRVTPRTMRDEIAQLIAEKIQDICSDMLSEAQYKPALNEVGLLSELVDFIHVFKVPELSFARWTVPRPGLVANLTLNHLEKPINDKKKKFGEYKQKVDEVWLLMISDRRLPSQKFQTPAEFCTKSLSSPFAKTFYYCYAAEQPTIEI